MCSVKTPKVDRDPNDDKDPPILRNPILDGMLGNIAAIRGGRNSLRIPLIDPLRIPVGGGVGGGVSGGGDTGGSSSVSSGSGSGSGSGMTSSSSTGDDGRTGRTFTFR